MGGGGMDPWPSDVGGLQKHGKAMKWSLPQSPPKEPALLAHFGLLSSRTVKITLCDERCERLLQQE